MPKLTNDELQDLYADDEGRQLVQDIHDRVEVRARSQAEAMDSNEPTVPQNLVLKEFKSTVLPKQSGTRKVDTWHTADEARTLWVERVKQYPVMTQVTPTEKLRLAFGPAGRMTVAGEVVIDLTAAAQIKIEGMTADDQ